MLDVMDRSKDKEIDVGRFLNFAMIHAKTSNHILCSYIKNGNMKHQTVDE